MTFYILGFAVLLVILFIVIELRSNPRVSMFFKGFASLGFMLVFASAFYENLIKVEAQIPSSYVELGQFLYAGLILLGLACGILGDLYLAIRPMEEKRNDKKIIIGGILYFALGHLFYLFLIFGFISLNLFSIGLGLIMVLVIYLGSRILDFKMGEAKYYSLAYTFIIFLFVGQAISLAIANDFNTFSVLILVGSILFSISDLILAPIYFKEDDSKYLIVINYVTYYGAQLCIALSVLYLL